MSWRKYLAIPQLIYHGIRAPRDQARAWDRFWAGVRKTGMGGDVLWDGASQVEMDALLESVRAHMDAGLPVVDVGCGNGRQTRFLAAHFPEALGVDVSPSAIKRARQESGGVANVGFHVADISVPGALRSLLRSSGDANVHVRGVFHLLDDERRRALAENIRELVGRRGAVYLFESNIEGNPLDHLEFQGATLTSMPDPLRRCIASGIRPPSHFGDEQVRTYFPPSRWEVAASGKSVTHGVPLHQGRDVELIPSFFAVLRPRAAAEVATRGDDAVA